MERENTEWFVHDRFGLFVHWGIYSVAGRHEWIQSREKIAAEDYQAYFDHFDPDLYDPAAWARMAKAAGMKYAVLTSKHHDGFAMWDSGLTDFKVTNTPAGRDVVREFVDAFRAEGLKIGFYHSVIDWHHPDYTMDQTHPYRDHDADAFNAGRDMSRYREFLHGQVRELLTNYGKIDVMWFDWTPPQKSRADWDSEALAKMVRELQPGIILNDRIDYPESADFVTPEEYQARSWPERNGQRMLWETCQTLNGSWGYYRDNINWKSPEMLCQLLVDTVSKGGNLLLNVGPTGRGELEPQAQRTLAEIGEWMRRHGRAIYGATAADEAAPVDCRFTQRGDRLYLHIFSWPLRHVHLEGFAGRIQYAQFLHDGSEIQFRDADPDAVAQNTDMAEEAGTVILELPFRRPDVTVPVVELFLKEG
ncbi:MAG TPA: alpha-L-fucosidase [Thermomicrobiales bacterium]|nr:alpha-L-fucosidase [Thermomicrobiales bacterium]